jgi:phosphoesterase RecJ-like protein
MKSLKELVNAADSIVVIQADNPDGDSLASALALEAIFSELGKQTYLYCGVDIPGYLRYMNGWDRVTKTLPKSFDLSFIVDTGSLLLLETLQKTGEINLLKTKTCVVIDHHVTEPTIDFAKIEYIKPAVSTGELIYGICKENSWEIPFDAAEHIVNSIMSDSLGLISENTTSNSVGIIADLIDRGVSLAKLDSKRKELQKKQPVLLGYKGELLGRIKYLASGQLAYITIPWEEIEKYSPLYNPTMLVIDEMRQVIDVKLAIALKFYPDGRITAKLRSNYGSPICNKIAEKFGGGGHPYASGFRVTDGSKAEDILKKCEEIFLEELTLMEKEADEII